MDSYRDDLLWKNISELPYFRGFLRAIEARFYQSLTMQKPVLDVGCGDGHFGKITFVEDINVGVDPQFSSLLEAKKSDKYLLLVCAGGTRLPFSTGYFGSAFSNSVLEHIKPVDEVIQDIFRILKEKGIFIVTAPNNHFVNNLSVAQQLEKLNLNRLASGYKYLFNLISRHFHTDTYEIWLNRFLDKGFMLVKGWNYFSEKALKILEWGHIFGIPSWIAKKIFGKWVLVNRRWNLYPLFKYLKKHYLFDQKCADGAYSFFVLEK